MGAEATVGAGVFRASDWSAMANDPVAQEAEVGSCRKKQPRSNVLSIDLKAYHRSSQFSHRVSLAV